MDHFKVLIRSRDSILRIKFVPLLSPRPHYSNYFASGNCISVTVFMWNSLEPHYIPLIGYIRVLSFKELLLPLRGFKIVLSFTSRDYYCCYLCFYKLISCIHSHGVLSMEVVHSAVALKTSLTITKINIGMYVCCNRRTSWVHSSLTTINIVTRHSR